MNQSKPRAILITGASSGIGAALARRYAGQGIYLALTGRSAERLEAIATACGDKGAKVDTLLADVTDEATLATWINACDEANALDLVIANAGISGGTGGSSAGEDPEQARRIFDVNVTGVLNTINPVIPRMVARRSGQIALMSSLASFSGWAGAPAYSASKAAVRFYGEALRGSLANKGVRVNVLCPGFIRTPMTAVNDYSMPFMISAEKAAELIADGLDRNKGRIAFPLPTYFFAGLLGLLPPQVGSFIIRQLPAKPAVNI